MKQFNKELRSQFLKLSDVSEDFLRLSETEHLLIKLSAAVVNNKGGDVLEHTEDLIKVNRWDIDKVLNLLSSPLPETISQLVPSVYEKLSILDVLKTTDQMYIRFCGTLVENLNKWHLDKDFKMSETLLDIMEVHFNNNLKALDEFIDTNFTVIRKPFYNRFIKPWNDKKAVFLKSWYAQHRDMETGGNFHYNRVEKMFNDVDFIKYVINADCDNCYFKLIDTAVFKATTTFDRSYFLLDVILDNIRPSFFLHTKNTFNNENPIRQNIIVKLLDYINKMDVTTVDCLMLFYPEMIQSTISFEKVLKSVENNLKIDKFPNMVFYLNDIFQNSAMAGNGRYLNVYSFNKYKALKYNTFIDVNLLFETILSTVIKLDNYNDTYLKCDPELITENVLIILAEDSFSHILKLENKYPELFG